VPGLEAIDTKRHTTNLFLLEKFLLNNVC
jgi:hypothetical protein